MFETQVTKSEGEIQRLVGWEQRAFWGEMSATIQRIYTQTDVNAMRQYGRHIANMRGTERANLIDIVIGEVAARHGIKCEEVCLGMNPEPWSQITIADHFVIVFARPEFPRREKPRLSGKKKEWINAADPVNMFGNISWKKEPKLLLLAIHNWSKEDPDYLATFDLQCRDGENNQVFSPINLLTLGGHSIINNVRPVQVLEPKRPTISILHLKIKSKSK